MSSEAQLQADALAALAQSSRKPRPTAALLQSFDAVTATVSDDGSNKFDLLCPRAGCGSLVLKAGVAEYIEAPSVELDPPSHPAPAPLEALPPSGETIKWWLVKPNPMAFENIGFSKPVDSGSAASSGKKMKLLACAECDLGPLGWCEEGGKEFWIATSRIGYRT